MRIYCIQTELKPNSEKLILDYYKLYCKEKGANYNSSVKVSRAKNGKPFLSGSDIHFSLSHTSSLTVICFAPFNIGIDCESVTRKTKHQSLITDRIYSQKEKEYATDDERFIEIWVKKEAYAKYTGKGLSGIRNINTFSLKGEFKLTYYNGHIICTYHE